MPAPTTTTSGRARIPASLDSQLVFDYAGRQRRLAERMEAEAVDVLFLGPSADLEYLTGVERQIPNFGEAAYANGWVAGAFLRPGADPIFVFRACSPLSTFGRSLKASSSSSTRLTMASQPSSASH